MQLICCRVNDRCSKWFFLRLKIALLCTLQSTVGWFVHFIRLWHLHNPAPLAIIYNFIYMYSRSVVRFVDLHIAGDYYNALGWIPQLLITGASGVPDHDRLLCASIELAHRLLLHRVPTSVTEHSQVRQIRFILKHNFIRVIVADSPRVVTRLQMCLLCMWMDSSCIGRTTI